MGKYYIAQSKFKPFTYQEMYAQAANATKAHREQATLLGALDAQAANQESYLDPERDSIEYNTIINYRKGLEAASNDLAQRGLSNKTYNDVLGLSTMYAKDVKPIEDMVNNYKQGFTTYNKIATEHPEMIMLKPWDNYRVSDFKYGMPDIPTINGNNYSTEIANAIKLLFASDISLKRYTTPGNVDYIPGKIMARLQAGFSPEKALQAVKNEMASEDFEKLSAAISTVNKRYGVDKLDPVTDKDALNKLAGFMNEGIIGAIASPELKAYDNPYDRPRSYGGSGGGGVSNPFSIMTNLSSVTPLSGTINSSATKALNHLADRARVNTFNSPQEVYNAIMSDPTVIKDYVDDDLLDAVIRRNGDAVKNLGKVSGRNFTAHDMSKDKQNSYERAMRDLAGEIFAKGNAIASNGYTTNLNQVYRGFDQQHPNSMVLINSSDRKTAKKNLTEAYNSGLYKPNTLSTIYLSPDNKDGFVLRTERADNGKDGKSIYDEYLIPFNDIGGLVVPLQDGSSLNLADLFRRNAEQITANPYAYFSNPSNQSEYMNLTNQMLEYVWSSLRTGVNLNMSENKQEF